MTGIRYRQVGALVITMIGLALRIRLDMTSAGAFARSGWLFVAGVGDGTTPRVLIIPLGSLARPEAIGRVRTMR